jgi:hypothetical protein
MHRSLAVSILVSIFCICRPGDLSAEDVESSTRVWDFDSIAPADLANSSPAREVYMAEMQANNHWNAHDLEGFFDGFWNSPQLLVVQDGEAIEGYQKLYEKFKEGYADRDRMGKIHFERVKIRMIDPDIAFALIVWTVNYDNTVHATVGTNTEYLEKFDNGWKVISSHASNGEL